MWITLIALGSAVLARFVAVEERQTNNAVGDAKRDDRIEALDAWQRAADKSRAQEERQVAILNRLVALEVQMNALREELARKRR